MKKLFLYTSLLLALASCKKESDTFEGPSLQDLYGEFSVLEDFAISNSTPDFGAGDLCYFTAKFSKPVNWTVTIVGDESGATKIIEGQSRELDETNTLWEGSTTELPVFRAEACTATLTVEDVTDTFSLELEVISPKNNEGFVLADFETNGFDPGWTVFIQSGAKMDFRTKQDSYSPQGVGYLNMAGEVNWDWLIGLVDFNATAYGTDPVLPLPTDAENLYFNCLIYGEPGNNQTLILFQFKEDENEDGNFDANNEDMYALEVRVDWEGWKLVSVKYADLAALVNGQPAEPNGNKIKEPNKLGLVSLLHLADPAGGFASSKIDYIIFTQTPLQP